jgi:hypothetical protein
MGRPMRKQSGRSCGQLNLAVARRNRGHPNGRTQRVHRAAAAASRTRIDSSRASISCTGTTPSIRGGTPSRGPLGTLTSI